MSLSDYAAMVRRVDHMPEPHKEFFRQYYAARHNPQDHEVQLAYIEYLTKAFPGETTAYLKAHDVSKDASGADASEEAASLYLFRVAQGIFTVIASEVGELADLARKVQAEGAT